VDETKRTFVQIRSRRDALTGLACLYRSLFDHNQLPRSSRVLRIGTATETGFTTVPAEETIEIIMNGKDAETFTQTLAQYGQIMRKERDINITHDRENVMPGAYTVIDTRNTALALSIPLDVDLTVEGTVLGRFAVNPKRSLIGEVRGTISDFKFDPAVGLSFNIDQRSVDPAQGKRLALELRNGVDHRLKQMGLDPQQAREVISDTPPSPVDTESVRIKQKLATVLGYKTVIMPSVPGQDSGSISKAGVPTSMTFIRHPGTSHNKDETVDPKFLTRAVSLSHEYLHQLLIGNQTKPSSLPVSA